MIRPEPFGTGLPENPGRPLLQFPHDPSVDRQHFHLGSGDARIRKANLSTNAEKIAVVVRLLEYDFVWK